MTKSQNEAAAFEAWQLAKASEFHLLVAYKYGDQEHIMRAREHLMRAVSRLDAVMADAPQAEGVPV